MSCYPEYFVHVNTCLITNRALWLRVFRAPGLWHSAGCSSVSVHLSSDRQGPLQPHMVMYNHWQVQKEEKNEWDRTEKSDTLVKTDGHSSLKDTIWNLLLTSKFQVLYIHIMSKKNLTCMWKISLLSISQLKTRNPSPWLLHHIIL